MPESNAGRLSLLALVLLSGLGSVAAAQAQEARADNKETVELSEVLVTSQKMSQTLEQVPASVSALSGEQIRDTAGSNFADLQNYTANVSISLSAGAGQYSIRGFGTPDTNT